MEDNNIESAMESLSQQQEAAAKAGRALRLALRILTTVATLLLVALAIYLVVNRSRFNLDSFRRYLTYRSLERQEDGTTATFSIGQEDKVCYVTLSDAVILCSGNRIQLFSDGGVKYEDISAVMQAPVIHTAANYAVVYDAGGSELYLFADRQSVYHYTTKSGYGLISARVNERGWLCIVEQEHGYKGSVTVYNAAQEPVVTERISSQFVMDAVISPDNRELGIITIGQGETTFTSTLSIYSISSGEQVRSTVVGDMPILEVEWDSEGFWLQHEYGIIRMNNQCRQLANWSNNTLHLQGYSMGGDGFVLQYFSRDRSGALGQLTTVDSDGNILGTRNMSREILSVTAAGRYLAVLTSSQLTIYTPDFTEYATLPNSNGIQAALVRSDGTAMLIQGENAGVFLP